MIFFRTLVKTIDHNYFPFPYYSYYYNILSPTQNILDTDNFNDETTVAQTQSLINSTAAAVVENSTANQTEFSSTAINLLISDNLDLIQANFTSQNQTQTLSKMTDHQSFGHQFWHIFLVSTVMFLGCFVSGMIPLSTSLSQRKIQLCSIFGAGLLVGVALAVIIPEGVSALYSLGGDNDGSEKDQGFTVAVSLIAGFVMMLLIDNLGGGHSHSHGGPPARPGSPDYQRLDTESNVTGSGASTPPQRSSGSNTITLGLIVHAAADGIALGAASATERSDLQLIVFIAIMLHKAPAAFGLTSVLLREHLSHDRIRTNLFIFSLAAPMGAIATIVVFYLIGGGETLGADWGGPAIAMLFSAGTFLYVATVHVLPEVTHGEKVKGWDLILLNVGIVLPLLLGRVFNM